VSRTKALFIFTLLVVYGCAAAQRISAQEQQQQQQPAGTPPAATAANPAERSGATQTPAKTNDLEITANVTARELRFEVVPDPKVEFTGQPERETVWEAERQNLPRPVQPGVTYRNIGVQLKITSAFADIERIVAEALGEVPATDDAPKENASPQVAQPQGVQPPAATIASPSAAQQEGKP
jgi:hypothetical protein